MGGRKEKKRRMRKKAVQDVLDRLLGASVRGYERKCTRIFHDAPSATFHQAVALVQVYLYLLFMSLHLDAKPLSMYSSSRNVLSNGDSERRKDTTVHDQNKECKQEGRI
jgi:hypothetical protein